MPADRTYFVIKSFSLGSRRLNDKVHCKSLYPSASFNTKACTTKCCNMGQILHDVFSSHTAYKRLPCAKHAYGRVFWLVWKVKTPDQKPTSGKAISKSLFPVPCSHSGWDPPGRFRTKFKPPLSARMPSAGSSSRTA